MDIGIIFWSSIGSVSLLAIAAFLGKELIKKSLNKTIDHIYDARLESHKAELNRINNEEIEVIRNKLARELEITKSRLQFETNMTITYLTRYSDKQFELYNELWASLCDLKFCVQKLWEIKSVDWLIKLSEQLKIAYEKCEKSALLIEPGHYNELQIILQEISDFKIGKANLIELRKGSNVTQENINDIITNNGHIKERLEEYLRQFMGCLRRQISGKLDMENNIY
jgi:hypothetical protein